MMVDLAGSEPATAASLTEATVSAAVTDLLLMIYRRTPAAGMAVMGAPSLHRAVVVFARL